MKISTKPYLIQMIYKFNYVLVGFWVVNVSYESSLAFNTRYTAKEKHDFMAPFR